MSLKESHRFEDHSKRPHREDPIPDETAVTTTPRDPTTPDVPSAPQAVMAGTHQPDSTVIPSGDMTASPVIDLKRRTAETLDAAPTVFPPKTRLDAGRHGNENPEGLPDSDHAAESPDHTVMDDADAGQAGSTGGEDGGRVPTGNVRPEHERASTVPSKSGEILAHAKAVWGKRPKWGYGSYVATAIVLLLVSTLLQTWSTNTDAPYDPSKGLIGQAWSSSRQFVTDNPGLFNLVPLTLVYLILVTVLNRFWAASGIFMALSYAVAVANKCKITARNEPIIPSDLGFVTGGGGAGNVAGFVEGSMKTLVDRGIKAVAVVLLAFTVMQFIDRRRGVVPCSWRHWRRGVGNVFALVARVVSPVVAVSLLVGWSYALCDTGSSLYKYLNKEYGYSPQLWNTLDDAKAWGSLTTFTSLTHVKAMDEPVGYSQDAMREIYRRYKDQADAMNQSRTADLTDSTVVMVLSETFSDPNRLPGVGFEQDVMPLTHETQATTTAGTMLSPGYGGGTANIEFQAVTGLSMTNFNPALLSPYQQLVPRLKSLYTFNQTWNETGDCGPSCSIAIHPYYKSFYLRDSNYKKFGFSEFSTLDSETPVRHQDKIDRSGYVSDAAAYQEVLDKINADPSKSKFVQLVTMQNHMPYNGEYDNNEFVGLDRSTALTDDERFHLDSYAKGINHTDRETRDFLDRLDEIDRPITVIFYGDHLPGIYGSLASGKANEIALHETEYFIWSNRASASHDVRLDPAANAYTSSNYFMAQAAEHMGARVSPYLAMLTRLHQAAPATTRLAQTLGEWKNSDTVTVLGNDGKIIPGDALNDEAKTALADYAMVQYDMTVGGHWLEGMGFTDVPDTGE